MKTNSLASESLIAFDEMILESGFVEDTYPITPMAFFSLNPTSSSASPEWGV
jgi:hypothetical protein